MLLTLVRKTRLLALLALLVAGLHAQDGSWRAVPTGSSGGSPTFGYWEYLPAHYETRTDWPLLIFLHGVGERGDGSSSALTMIPRSGPPRLCAAGVDFPGVVLSPQTAGSWTSETAGIIDFLLTTYADRTDEEAFVLTGLSMGGQGAGHYAQVHADKLAALALIDASGSPLPPTVASMQDLPLWLFHGWKDSAKGQTRLWHRAYLNEHFSRTYSDAEMDVLGLNVQESFIDLPANDAIHTAHLAEGADIYGSSLVWTPGVQPQGTAFPFVTYYPDLGHGSWNVAYGTAASNVNWTLFNWLFAQRRDVQTEPPPPPVPVPFSGSPVQLPALIEAEHFDCGGHKIACSDIDEYMGSGFRSDERVDTYISGDPTGGSFVISSIYTGEWLGYTIETSVAQEWTVTLRVSANATGSTVSLLSGTDLVAGPVAIPQTGGSSAWTDLVITEVALPLGVQQLRVYFGDAPFNARFNHLIIEDPTGDPISGVARRLIEHRIEDAAGGIAGVVVSRLSLAGVVEQPLFELETGVDGRAGPFLAAPEYDQTFGFDDSGVVAWLHQAGGM